MRRAVVLANRNCSRDRCPGARHPAWRSHGGRKMIWNPASIWVCSSVKMVDLTLTAPHRRQEAEHVAPRSEHVPATRSSFALALVALAWASAGAACKSNGEEHRATAVAVSPNDSKEMNMIAQQAVFFGHQSVGSNILAGAQRHFESSPANNAQIVQTRDPAKLERGVWAHALVGRNTDPLSKIHDFDKIMKSGMAQRADIAFFKFCYIDFNAQTDVSRLFDEYKRVLLELTEKFPTTTFVHMTVPLTVVQTGPKAWVKRLLGRPVWGRAENATRGVFNDLLRKHYSKDLLFDLGRLEATPPNGALTSEVHGEDAPESLHPAYTDDGGHLNARGQSYVASELITFLADVSRRRQKEASPSPAPK